MSGRPDIRRLTEDQVIILRSTKDKLSNNAAAKLLGITENSVRLVRNGYTYKEIAMPKKDTFVAPSVLQ